MLYISSRTYVFCSLLFPISIILLVLSGERETIPGPDPGYSNSFSFCHWNLNSIAAHNFLTTPYIRLILSVYQKPLQTTLISDDNQLVLRGYNLIRADNPNNIKRRRVCIYYRETLPIKVTNVNILNECLVWELSFGSRRVYLVSIY